MFSSVRHLLTINVKKSKRLLLGCAFLLSANLFAQSEMAPEIIRVACAANARFAIEVIAADFAKQHRVKVDVITASSGKLSAQIRAGAPFDVFVSADEIYPEQLHQQRITPHKPRVYGVGSLILWSPASAIPLQWQEWIVASNGKIAIANPDTAPYGEQALRALQYYQLLPALESRLIRGESIGQVNQFVSTRAAPLAFTALSALSTEEQAKTDHWRLLPAESHQAIRQAAVLLDTNSSAAKAFFAYLYSPPAQKQLQNFGYQLP